MGADFPLKVTSKDPKEMATKIEELMGEQPDIAIECSGATPSIQTAIYVSCVLDVIITQTCLYNIDPLKPHFYIVKLGFTGVYIIFLISAQNIDYGYSLELPQRAEICFEQKFVLSRNLKNIRIFI